MEKSGWHIIKEYTRITSKAIGDSPAQHRRNPWERKEALGFSKALVDSKDLAWVLDKIELNLEKFKCSDYRLSRKIPSIKKQTDLNRSKRHFTLEEQLTSFDFAQIKIGLELIV